MRKNPLKWNFVIPSRPEVLKSLELQITTAKEHSVVIREFGNLFDLGALRAQKTTPMALKTTPTAQKTTPTAQRTTPTVQRTTSRKHRSTPEYRFLMVRVAANAEEAVTMRKNPLKWNFVIPSRPEVLKSLEDRGFPERIRFYECIWILHDALVAYKEDRDVK
jgi:hypothetical protein